MKVDCLFFYHTNGKFMFHKRVTYNVVKTNVGNLNDLSIAGLTHNYVNENGRILFTHVLQSLHNQGLDELLNNAFANVPSGGSVIMSILLDNTIVSYDMLNNLTSFATHPNDVITYTYKIREHIENHIIVEGTAQTCPKWYEKQLASHTESNERMIRMQRLFHSLV